MAQEIKDLIAKIQAEGIKIAEEKAKEIEARALAAAEKIINLANSQGKKIIADATEQVVKERHSAEASLNQAGRDFLILLKSRINVMLDKLVT